MATSDDIFKHGIEALKRNWPFPTGPDAQLRLTGLMEEFERDTVGDIKAIVDWLKINYNLRSFPLPSDIRRARSAISSNKPRGAAKSKDSKGEHWELAKRFLRGSVGRELATQGYARPAFIWVLKRGRFPQAGEIGKMKSSWDLFRREVADGKLIKRNRFD